MTKQLTKKRKSRSSVQVAKVRRNTAERIAEIALRILEEEGPEHVSMRRIALAAGITPMAIYHHYPNREALLKSITDAEFAKLKEYSDSLLAKYKGKPDLTLMGLPYIDYAFQRPRVFDYVFSKPRFDARKYPEDFRARRSPTLTPLADFLADAIKNRELKKDDVWEVALQVWAQAHGYMALYRAGRFSLSEKEFRALYRRGMKRLLDGLRVKSGKNRG